MRCLVSPKFKYWDSYAKACLWETCKWAPSSLNVLPQPSTWGGKKEDWIVLELRPCSEECVYHETGKRDRATWVPALYGTVALPSSKCGLMNTWGLISQLNKSSFWERDSGKSINRPCMKNIFNIWRKSSRSLLSHKLIIIKMLQCISFSNNQIIHLKNSCYIPKLPRWKGSLWTYTLPTHLFDEWMNKLSSRKKWLGWIKEFLDPRFLNQPSLLSYVPYHTSNLKMLLYLCFIYFFFYASSCTFLFFPSNPNVYSTYIQKGFIQVHRRLLKGQFIPRYIHMKIRSQIQ